MTSTGEWEAGISLGDAALGGPTVAVLEEVILDLLAREGPADGFAIFSRLREARWGRVLRPEGALYPLLHRMVRLGRLSARWTPGAAGYPVRRYSVAESRVLTGQREDAG